MRLAKSTLVLTDDDEMRELNRTWRGKDASTNVLSFPAGEPVGEAHGEPSPLGDVVLAGETVIEEAKLQGHPRSPITPPISSCTACCISWVSTMSATRDAERMEALETKVLAGLGIADPYAEDARRSAAEVMP